MAFEADDFEACLQQVFVLTDGDYQDELELISVDRLPNADVAGDRKQAFSLVFRSRRETIIEQRIYAMQNERLGEVEIFIVPIAQDAEGVRYEAVFS